MEDKQAICDQLCKTLQMTRNAYDLVKIEYERRTNDFEVVTIHWASGGNQLVNVSLDSGTAMIRDIMKSID